MRHVPTAARLLLLHRGVGLFAATFVPSLTPPPTSVSKNCCRTLFRSKSSSSSSSGFLSSPSCKRQQGHPAAVQVSMTDVPELHASPAAQHTSCFCKKLRGEWSLHATVALARIVPKLDASNYKGQLGRVGVLGGSKDYTGAPFFASMSALRMGADLAYVFTAEEAAPALKAYSPELMVTPVYSAAWPEGDTKGQNDLVESVTALLPKLHSLAVGPGMGRDPRVLGALADILPKARSRNLPIVLDADAIAMVVTDPETVKGYPLAVLTPNANEFRLLCDKMGDASMRDRDPRTWFDDDDELASTAAVVERLATFLGNVTIVLKGKTDIISNGKRTIGCNVAGSLKRCGGIGDVLSGAISTSLAWISVQGFLGPEEEELRLWATWWACAVTRTASRKGYEANGRAMSATNVLEQLGSVLESVAPCPVAKVPPLHSSNEV